MTVMPSCLSCNVACPFAVCVLAAVPEFVVQGAPACVCGMWLIAVMIVSRVHLDEYVRLL